MVMAGNSTPDALTPKTGREHRLLVWGPNNRDGIQAWLAKFGEKSSIVQKNMP